MRSDFCCHEQSHSAVIHLGAFKLLSINGSQLITVRSDVEKVTNTKQLKVYLFTTLLSNSDGHERFCFETNVEEDCCGDVLVASLFQFRLNRVKTSQCETGLHGVSI